MPGKAYRKQPVEILAVRYGIELENVNEVSDFLKQGCPEWEYEERNKVFRIKTPEGRMLLKPGDWLIKGVAGEFYPCRHDIFKQTYEEV